MDEALLTEFYHFLASICSVAVFPVIVCQENAGLLAALKRPAPLTDRLRAAPSHNLSGVLRTTNYITRETTIS